MADPLRRWFRVPHRRFLNELGVRPISAMYPNQKYAIFSIEDEIGLPDIRPSAASNLARISVHRTLTKVARKTQVIDVVACGAVFSSFEESSEIRHVLERELESLQLNEMGFYILVVLYTLGPMPITSTGLAYQLDQLETTITPTVSLLASKNWIARQSDSASQGTKITLTPKGSDLASDAIQRYLRTVRELYSGRWCGNSISPYDDSRVFE